MAACVNILPAVESIYRWEGEVERSDEVLTVMKTTCYSSLEPVLRGLHPYDVPEIIALPITAGLPEYLKWVAEGCG